MHNAAWHNKIELIRQLLSFGAKINVQDITGSTPLRKAAYKGQADAVKHLLSKLLSYIIIEFIIVQQTASGYIQIPKRFNAAVDGVVFSKNNFKNFLLLTTYKDSLLRMTGDYALLGLNNKTSSKSENLNTKECDSAKNLKNEVGQLHERQNIEDTKNVMM